MKLKWFKSGNGEKNAAKLTLYLLGNPNVGKSTVFNALTGLKQHTGNWSGKTVDAAFGKYTYNNIEHKIIDLPGTHAVNSCFSEEEVTGTEIMLGSKDSQESVCRSTTIIIGDGTSLERSIGLALDYLEKCGNNAIFCVNLCDIAKKKGIEINFEKLQKTLGIPVIGISAKKKSDINSLKTLIDDFMLNPKNIKIKSGLDGDAVNFKNDCSSSISGRMQTAKKIMNECVKYTKDQNEKNFEYKFDKILTSKRYGIPIMILCLGFILWLTICGANYPSDLLAKLFGFLKPYVEGFFVYLHFPQFLIGILCDGVYETVTWIIAVMLPPMAIFFPLFTLLEDFGFLPRIAFNLDKCYARTNMSGKQCLTQCMGLGCNCVGVVGARIMPNETQRTVAILTNSLMPCNGRFALLIAMSTIFIGGSMAVQVSGVIPMLCVLFLICLSVVVTWCVSYCRTKTIYKNDNEIFALELPEYRKPEIAKTLIISLVNRTAKIVGRALLVSAPTGALVWLMANIQIDGITLLSYASNALDPFGRFLGVDGFIILAFILSLPANEITLPILVMGYLATGSMTEISDMETLKNILTANGWTIVTAINMMLLTLYHSPCITTLLTIYSETKSLKTVALSIVIPCVVGILLCLLVKYGFAIISLFM